MMDFQSNILKQRWEILIWILVRVKVQALSFLAHKDSYPYDASHPLSCPYKNCPQNMKTDFFDAPYPCSNRNFYHPYLLTRRESMRDMDPNPCALESTGLELSNARGFKSTFFTVAIKSWLEHEWFWKHREFQRIFLQFQFLREQATVANERNLWERFLETLFKLGLQQWVLGATFGDFSKW